MSKLLILMLFIGCCIYYGCNEDYPPPIIIQQGESTIEEDDSCNGFNLIACSFDFRKGKWLEILDSLEMQHYEPDTVWFKEDSLIGWTNQSDEYKFYKSYFSQNLLYKQPWNSNPDDPIAPSGIHTEYNEETQLFRINWASGTSPRDYKRVD